MSIAAQPLPALIRLSESATIPTTGLRQSKLAVSLTSDSKLRTAWPSEITIADDSPWHRGEERLVELRIEAKPFCDYVACWRPKLYVCQNGEIIGHLHVATPAAMEKERRD